MDLATKSDEKILAIAEPIMDNLMGASTAIDHPRHLQDFTDRLKAIVTKDYLEKVCRQYPSDKGYFGPRTPSPSSAAPTPTPPATTRSGSDCRSS